MSLDRLDAHYNGERTDRRFRGKRNGGDGDAKRVRNPAGNRKSLSDTSSRFPAPQRNRSAGQCPRRPTGSTPTHIAATRLGRLGSDVRRKCVTIPSERQLHCCGESRWRRPTRAKMVRPVRQAKTDPRRRVQRHITTAKTFPIVTRSVSETVPASASGFDAIVPCRGNMASPGGRGSQAGRTPPHIRPSTASHKMTTEESNPVSRRSFCRTLALPAGAIVLGSALPAWARRNKQEKPSTPAQQDSEQPKYETKVLWDFGGCIEDRFMDRVSTYVYNGNVYLWVLLPEFKTTIVKVPLDGSTVQMYPLMPGHTTGDDPHRYYRIAADSLGYVHVCGDMHSSPFVKHWISKRPEDISEFCFCGRRGQQPRAAGVEGHLSAFLSQSGWSSLSHHPQQRTTTLGPLPQRAGRQDPNLDGAR